VSIYYDADLSLAGSSEEGETYSITIAAELAGETSPTTLSVTLKNPCLSTETYSVNGDAANLDFQFNMATHTENPHTHQPFTVVANEAITGLCGGLVYTVDAGVDTDKIKYTPEIFEVEVISEDAVMIG
jgi:hypothetical protein